MIGIYFSGTGNTKHCVEAFLKRCDQSGVAISMEDPSAAGALREQETIVFGYPVYFSSIPRLVRDFILENREGFAGKKVFVIATMGLFSGDGAGCAARLLRACGARVVGGLHLKMPDCIGDVKLLKKPLAQNWELILQADERIAQAAQRWMAGRPPREGLSFFCRVAGFCAQRLWFGGKTATYQQKPNVDRRTCTGCGRCAGLCPTGNIDIIEGKAVSHGKCTLCYRCVSHCPAQALTILGKRVFEQCLFERYR